MTFVSKRKHYNIRRLRPDLGEFETIIFYLYLDKSYIYRRLNGIEDIQNQRALAQNCLLPQYGI